MTPEKSAFQGTCAILWTPYHGEQDKRKSGKKMKIQCPVCNCEIEIDSSPRQYVDCPKCGTVIDAEVANPVPPARPSVPASPPAPVAQPPRQLAADNEGQTVPCSSCGGTIYRKADVCPHCGKRYSYPCALRMLLLQALLNGLALLLLLPVMNNSDEEVVMPVVIILLLLVGVVSFVLWLLIIAEVVFRKN